MIGGGKSLSLGDNTGKSISIGSVDCFTPLAAELEAPILLSYIPRSSGVSQSLDEAVVLFLSSRLSADGASS